MHEIASRDRPSLNYPGQGDGSGDRKIEVICGSNCKVGEKFDVTDAVRSELEGANW